MRSRELREHFLHFFEARGHHRLPSASLIPDDDPSVLFNVAGMVPLKPYFLGRRPPPAVRATSCQKCFRTVDIEEVGRTPRHDTFFEMLGNFSFGDYFKETAIPLAWELLTRVYGLPEDRLFPSVHPEDAAALELWTRTIGVAPERVARLEENFWPAGAPVAGPCGHDSEIYWDRQIRCSCGRPACGPGCEGDRYVELWNLVFMEFDRDGVGRLNPLPRPSIDTGMGLERMAAVLQDRASIFETDLFAPIIQGLEGRSEADGRPPEERLVSLRICADHLRAAVFLIADGVRPGPDRRGYVLRWIIRRASRHAHRLSLDGGLAAGVDDVVAVMGDVYPDLRDNRDHIVRHLAAEEEAFADTMEEGVRRLESLLADGSASISGEDAFRLHDTYGFPIELTTEMASERGAVVDLAGFEAEMERQRERSRPVRSAGVFGGGPDLPATAFVGYDRMQAEAAVMRVATAAGEMPALEPGTEGEVLLDPSPFYAEAGGQVGDTGHLSWDGGRARVLDTVHLSSGQARSHRVLVEAGRLAAGSVVTASVDAPRRLQISRHHSATHLLHRTLRDVLGEGAVQHGSYVGPRHTTFDFSFDRALTPEEIHEVERLVNGSIRTNLEREVQLLPIAEARATGAVALFGERYGETVRVVDFGGWARELCGGTHVARSGDIGAAIVVSESSIGRGLRRIEMVVGESAEESWHLATGALRRTAQLLRSRPDEVPGRVEALQSQLRQLARELEQARRGAGRPVRQPAVIEVIDGVRFAHVATEEEAGDAVSEAADRVFAEELAADGVAVAMGRSAMVVKVGGSALESGISAGRLVGIAAEQTGARGGGRPAYARGGVGDPARRRLALEAIRSALRERAGG